MKGRKWNRRDKESYSMNINNYLQIQNLVVLSFRRRRNPILILIGFLLRRNDKRDCWNNKQYKNFHTKNLFALSFRRRRNPILILIGFLLRRNDKRECRNDKRECRNDKRDSWNNKQYKNFHTKNLFALSFRRRRNLL